MIDNGANEIMSAGGGNDSDAQHDLNASVQYANEVILALMDNGASRGASCTRTTRGLIPGTIRVENDPIAVGLDGEELQSSTSGLYLYKRIASNGIVEIAVRRMRHTPNLGTAIVFSESCEVYDHDYTFLFNQRMGREMRGSFGRYCMALYMTASKLGWLRVVPIDEPSQQERYLGMLNAVQQSSMMISGPSRNFFPVSYTHLTLPTILLV